MNQEEQKKYWDEVAGKKKFTINIRQDVLWEFVRRDADILDFGCGYGRILAELAENGCKNLYGCDISSKMIAQARSHVPSAELTVNPGLIIPFADNSFDCVILMAVLTCIPANADQSMLVKQIYRVLRPNGIIYVGDFLLNDDLRNLERYKQYEAGYGQRGIFKLDDDSGMVLRHHDEDYICRLFSGFDFLRFEKTVHQTMNGNQSKGFFLIGRKREDDSTSYEPLEETLELQFPELNLDNDPDLADEVPEFEPVPDEDLEKIGFPPDKTAG